MANNDILKIIDICNGYMSGTLRFIYPYKKHPTKRSERITIEYFIDWLQGKANSDFQYSITEMVNDENRLYMDIVISSCGEQKLKDYHLYIETDESMVLQDISRLMAS